MTKTIEQRLAALEEIQANLLERFVAWEEVISESVSEDIDPLEAAHTNFADGIRNRRTGQA